MCPRPDERRFLADRMLGTLTRYLRFMGYDTVSANEVPPGDRREDTSLLERARTERRLLLTRDRELARRGGADAIWVQAEDVREQVRQLALDGLIHPELRMNLCSLCNEPLRPAREEEIAAADYAPHDRKDREFFWCSRCRKLYWMGSHGADLSRRLEKLRSGE
ncbi:MAG: Mut7-C RNAse domain-containing protein [Methanomicrobiales archaeon]|nr:Mut7-C RNAse domain-containing protein [Methanomicrobiales archaeon]